MPFYDGAKNSCPSCGKKAQLPTVDVTEKTATGGAGPTFETNYIRYKCSNLSCGKEWESEKRSPFKNNANLVPAETGILKAERADLTVGSFQLEDLCLPYHDLRVRLKEKFHKQNLILVSNGRRQKLVPDDVGLRRKGQMPKVQQIWRANDTKTHHQHY